MFPFLESLFAGLAFIFFLSCCLFVWLVLPMLSLPIVLVLASAVGIVGVYFTSNVIISGPKSLKYAGYITSSLTLLTTVVAWGYYFANQMSIATMLSYMAFYVFVGFFGLFLVVFLLNMANLIRLP